MPRPPSVHIQTPQNPNAHRLEHGGHCFIAPQSMAHSTKHPYNPKSKTRPPKAPGERHGTTTILPTRHRQYKHLKSPCRLHFGHLQIKHTTFSLSVGNTHTLLRMILTVQYFFCVFSHRFASIRQDLHTHKQRFFTKKS